MLTGIKVRLNTNGLANLYYKRNIVPEPAKVIDSVSISLNAPTAEKYQEVTRPSFDVYATLASGYIGLTSSAHSERIYQEELKEC